MTDYSPVNPKPSPGTGIDSTEGRSDTIVQGQNTPSITNIGSLDLSVEANRLKAAYSIGAMGQGSNLGQDSFMAQADIDRNDKPIWDISQIKIGGTVYSVSVAASGANYLLELS